MANSLFIRIRITLTFYSCLNQCFALGSSGRTRLYRSASLQEKGGGLGLSLLLNDTTRFKLSHRPSLLHLLPEDQAILLPSLPGTPTLHRPTIPPPPPPNTHPLLQPFNCLELSRINNVIRSADATCNEVGSSGSEFSDDEFDPIDIDYTSSHAKINHLETPF